MCCVKAVKCVTSDKDFGVYKIIWPQGLIKFTYSSVKFKPVQLDK